MSVRYPLACALALAFCVSAAAAGDRDKILASCAQQTNLPAPVCDCIADKAGDELSDPAYAFFIGMISGDEAEQARMRATTSPADMTAAAMFMTKAPGQCAQQ